MQKDIQGRRYYGGCEVVDVIEQLAIDRVKKLFGLNMPMFQPHSGSQANMAAYRALVKKRDKILGMDLNHGGHLTHGMGSKLLWTRLSFCFLWSKSRNRNNRLR